MPQRPLWKRVWYNWLRLICRLLAVVLCHMRVRGREHIPPGGRALVLSTHQSHLDPVLIGLGFNRRLNYVARETLFSFPPFRWLIQSLDAIPIDREGLGLSGLKETLRRLKREEMVLLFPEGTRSTDGEVGRIKPGFCALARRAAVPLLPVALDGAFAAWPRSAPLPWPSTVNVQIGEPIWPHEVATLSDDELIARLQVQLESLHATARADVRRGRGERC